MDPQDRMSKLEEIVATLANSQKEICWAISPKGWNKLSQQVSDKVKDDGEHSANKSGGRGCNNSGFNTFGSLNSFVPKTMKIDFPRYNGRDEPTTLGVQDREELKHGIFSRFGPNQFEDPFNELIRLRQSGSVVDDQGNFEKLLAKTGSLSQERKVSIRTDVKANRPTSLTMAIGLAKPYETCDFSLKKPTNQAVRPMNPQRAAPNVPECNLTNAPSIKRMTTDDLAERRRKGLCFHYNERYVPSHNCAKLFRIEACWAEDDDDGGVVMEVDGASENATPEISLHSMAGVIAHETM
ncbi:hypothetical protein TIFTF001_015075 [Ficus carica]|uniref:Uncharacterized protein n=1 Tax=Ficus carica TaxID=3494 RepID=A0AA88DIK5_FICCA|nr:hypothetical protein TIFTF001_015075 [Ficus carica]